MWCVAELTPDDIAHREDVLAIYERPYDTKKPVVCLDEKPVSLHADKRAPRPARPGHLAKRDTEYERCGTANLFGIVEPKAGRHFPVATADRSGLQFASAIRDLVAAYPNARTIRLVLDNLNTHRESSLIKHLGRRLARRRWRRLTVPDTPTHGRWLNQAEIELSLVARQCLGTQRIPALARLQTSVSAWNRRANRRKTRITWRFTRKDARRKFAYHPNLSMRSET